MEQTLNALSGLMLKAIPTICLFVILYFYMKAMLFQPLEKVLQQRDALTEGARKAADASFAAADRKQAEYEQKFADARTEIYRLQEETRRKWLEAQAAQVAESRAHMERSVRAAREQIAAEMVTAREGLDVTSAQLADQIVSAVLAPRMGQAA